MKKKIIPLLSVFFLSAEVNQDSLLQFLANVLFLYNVCSGQ